MVARIIHAYRVLNADYSALEARGPLASLRELAGSSPPFARYEAVKSALTACFPGIAWQDERQAGVLEDEMGRIEFECQDLSLEGGFFSAMTPDDQDAASTHRLLGRLSGATGLAILDEDTMEFVRPTEHPAIDRSFRTRKPPPTIEA